jgi:hypothetical protein
LNKQNNAWQSLINLEILVSTQVKCFPISKAKSPTQTRHLNT